MVTSSVTGEEVRPRVRKPTRGYSSSGRARPADVDVSGSAPALLRGTPLHASPAQPDVTYRPDGRAYVSIDAWTDADFARAANAVTAALPPPLFTLVDASEQALLERWHRAGFVPNRTEGCYVIPTARAASTPVDVQPFGSIGADRIDALHRALGAEVEAQDGWHTMPADLLPRGLSRPTDPTMCAVAVRGARDVGLLRVSGRSVQPRIGLLAVLEEERRSGAGTALLAYALDALDRRGTTSVITEVDDSRVAARALLDRFAARRVGTTVELVLR